jgi:hypothetical protein
MGLFSLSVLYVLEEFNLVAFFQTYHGFLPPGCSPFEPTSARQLGFVLALVFHGTHAEHSDIEFLLHSFRYLNLVGIEFNFKGIMTFFLHLGHFLGDNRALNYADHTLLAALVLERILEHLNRALLNQQRGVVYDIIG